MLLSAALYVCSIGMGTAPFAFSDTINGAVVAGIFSIANTLLTTIVLRHVREAKGLAQQNNERLGVVHDTARESVGELVDVKRKVRGDRRTHQQTPPDGHEKRKGMT